MMRQTAFALLGALALAAHPAAAAEPYVVINELQYHDGDDIADLEYVELHNAGDAVADLTGWSFDEGIAYRFPDGTRIPAGGFLVVARDAEMVAAVHGLPDGVIGDFEGELADGGERVRLVDRMGLVVDEVRYDDRDPWPTQCDGRGPSLERVGPDR
ncbi:MAG: lamin tail domain-containing protein, partial [Planctomycetes bacterium]|nr:lamin tail domain-containing protein [Planctomycetota bacterium]